MERDTFDRLVRLLAGARSRRDALRLFAAGVLVVVGAEESAAERPMDRVHRHTEQRNRKQRNRKRRDKNNNDKNNGQRRQHHPPGNPPGAGGTCRQLNELCGIFAGQCCAGAGIVCTGGIFSRCRYSCQTSQDCEKRFGSGYACAQCGDISCCAELCPDLCPIS